MKNARAAALKIALILEEYTPTEVKNAVKILRDSGRAGILLDYFANDQEHLSRKAMKSEIPLAGRQATPVETRSRAISRLEESEPEKFRILREFEKLIQAGDILKTNESVRNIGERTGKKFVARKSRKESIVALLEALSESNIEDIRNLIEMALSTNEKATRDEYQRLADFLIKGKG